MSILSVRLFVFPVLWASDACAALGRERGLSSQNVRYLTSPTPWEPLLSSHDESHVFSTSGRLAHSGHSEMISSLLEAERRH